MTDLQINVTFCCPDHGFAARIVVNSVLVYGVVGARMPEGAMAALEEGFASLGERELPTDACPAVIEHREHILIVIRRMREM